MGRGAANGLPSRGRAEAPEIVVPARRPQTWFTRRWCSRRKAPDVPGNELTAGPVPHRCARSTTREGSVGAMPTLAGPAFLSPVRGDLY